MSLPDTVFIFVLALIIFGPKKLPEIGRQLGRLVGEFRRASDEFKYQIEEELRQVEQSQTAKNPAATASLSETTDDSDSFAYESSSEYDSASDLDASLPVGQHPNIDAIEDTGFRMSNESDSASTDPLVEHSGEEPAETSAEERDFELEDGENVAVGVESMSADGAMARTTLSDSAEVAADETYTFSEPSGAEGVVIPFEKPGMARQPASINGMNGNGMNGSNPAEEDPSAHRRPVPVDPEIAHG